MKHKIKNDKKGIEIKIYGINEKQDELLKSFELCKQGKCDCPTDEYKKLDDLQIDSNKNEISLNLKAKSGEAFDKNEIEKCIDFTINKVNKK